MFSPVLFPKAGHLIVTFPPSNLHYKEHISHHISVRVKMLNPPVILSVDFTAFLGSRTLSPLALGSPERARLSASGMAKAIQVQLQNPVASGWNGFARLDGHSILLQAIFFSFFPILLFYFFVSLHPLIFTLKLWIVWMWNSRWNPAKAAEFHTGSTWKKYSTRGCSKLGPCFAKSFMNVSEPGFET